MPSPLTIPGVQVRTQFEPSPVLPGATGVLGVVGVADRGPIEPAPIGNVAELIDQFGAASRYTMPEIRTAFANGVARVWVARIAPDRGKKASVTVNDTDGEPAVTFVARAEGNWGNKVSVRVTPVATLTGAGVKYVDLEVLLDDEVVERIDNLVADPDSPNDLFTKVNATSRLIVAIDPVFATTLPGTIARTALADADARAATATLRSGAVNSILIQAKRPGPAGNLLAVQLAAAPASRTFDSADGPSLVVSTRQARPDGATFSITVQPVGPDSVSLTVNPPGAALRTYGPASSVDALVTAMSADPDVVASPAGSKLPTPVNQQRLFRKVDVVVFTEGREPRVHASVGTVDELVAINDPAVSFTAIGASPSLPGADEGNSLAGGRSKGPALALGADPDSPPLLELVPAPKVVGTIEVAVTQGTSSLDGSTATVAVDVFADGEPIESYADLTMDPDDPRYLPAVLADRSLMLRAKDLEVRSRTSALPTGPNRPFRLTGGVAPSADDYQDALDRLESAEEVDLVIASVARELSDADVRTVHQAVVAHCTKMSDVARNRIGLGSVTDGEAVEVAAMLDHADDVRSDHFILVAPARLEAAVAGLLGHQDFFESPTFKTVASPGATPGHYTDSQLEQLVNGNVAVVNERRRRGVIVVKGLLTSGMQINVRRTANKAVRDVQATAERYIGLLNNEGSRRALQQQIAALLTQMERDGALVPSTDGKDPAFTAAVYSSQNDFALCIVRIDIAVRPVRAIDYVYATILVKN